MRSETPRSLPAEWLVENPEVQYLAVPDCCEHDARPRPEIEDTAGTIRGGVRELREDRRRHRQRAWSRPAWTARVGRGAAGHGSVARSPTSRGLAPVVSACRPSRVPISSSSNTILFYSKVYPSTNANDSSGNRSPARILSHLNQPPRTLTQADRLATSRIEEVWK
jgi:hypothetical protein